MCAIFGIANNAEAANLTYLGLHSLQHRGQEAAGIVSSKGHAHRGRGLVRDVFTTENINALAGKSAIGHARYSTAGGSAEANVQPFLMQTRLGWVAVAHNGNLTNASDLVRSMEKQGSIFQSTSDTEVIVHLLAKAGGNLVEGLITALKLIEGAYSLVVLTDDTLVAVRDPMGFRPLVMGKLKDSTIFASETCAFDLLGAEYIREVSPGEMITVNLRDNTLKHHYPFARAPQARCIFEHVYFSRPDSHLFGSSVYEVRKGLGSQLAKEHPIAGDVVIPIPDSGMAAALGYSKQSGISFDMGMVRSHYAGRCVAASEFLTLANGEIVQAVDLIGQSFNVLSVNENGDVISAEAKAEFNDIEPVWELITESGMKIRRNAKHPLWVAERSKGRCGKHPSIYPVGWQGVSKINPGQLVAVTDLLATKGEKQIDEREVKILAYLIGDGGITTGNVVFSQEDNKQLKEFIECVKSYDCKVVQMSDYDWRVTKGYPLGGIRRSLGANEIVQILRKHGIMGKHGRDKHIPSAIFSLTTEQQSIFLSRLFSTDGHACLDKNNRAAIGFSSISERLVRDVQCLLLRFGVHSRLRKRKSCKFGGGGWTGEYCWEVCIDNSADLLLFVERVGVFGKEEAVDKVKNSALRKKHIRRWRRFKAPANTRWEKVISVRETGIEATVAIEVPGYNTYFDKLWEHNTFIQPKQSVRDFGVRTKLSPIAQAIKGKEVIAIDDSLVRGTTSKKIIAMLRQAGAKKVHLRISSPPTTHSCVYGIDTPTSKELIASSHSIEEVRQFIDADTLGYLSLEGLLQVVESYHEESSFCTACFSGDYPTETKRKSLKVC